VFAKSCTCHRSRPENIAIQTLPIFYRPEQTAANPSSSSPSASKPADVLASWRTLGIPLDIQTFEPLTRDQIKRAHHPFFVDALLDLDIDNGFGNRSAAVAASLPFTSGSMLAAAQEALRNGVGAISPTSGFHHAGYAHAGGYCSLNGLAITALNLPAGTRTGILDLDQHDPNGVRDIIERLDLDIPLVHGRGSPVTAERWLQGLAALIASTFASFDILLVQLGADPHIDDPLGGWLDNDQLRRRDRAVFETCRTMGLPLCWNLAGGYQRDAAGTIRPVLDIHDASLQECAQFWLR
jgi:acetoin utilization deacetylase AcuC-like enzyme